MFSFHDNDNGPPALDQYSNSISHTVQFHSERDGIPLFGRIWLPKRKAQKRTVIFGIHGFCEYSGRYLKLADFFNRQGYVLGMPDLRGHGDSSGPRSHVKDFREYVSDMATFYKLMVTQFPDRPIFIVTHSMGGLILAQWFCERGVESRIKAVYMSAPLFGVKNGVYHVVLDFASRIIGGLFPHFSVFFQRGVAAYLTHDELYLADRLRDSKVNRVVTMGWAGAMHKAVDQIFSHPLKISVPFFLAQAGSDTVVSNEMSKRFFDSIVCPNKRIKLYPGLYHEIFNEVDREVVFVELLNWMQGCGLN